MSVLHRLKKLTRSIIPKLFQLHFGKRLHLGNNLSCEGFPMIYIATGATISIGNNVTLNSISKGYHVLLHSPVKLMADRANATIEIGDNTRIHGSCLHAWDKICIGQNCLIAANSNIIDSNGHKLSFEAVDNRHNTQDNAKPVIIGNNVWIGTNVLVLPGTCIGDGSVIGAGSVIRGEIPPYCLVAGNPAKIIKHYNTGQEDKQRSISDST